MGCHRERARIVLQCCKENNVTISQKKLELSNKIKFAGHIISEEGYGPDNDKFTAIAKFPNPTGNVNSRSGPHEQSTTPTHEKRCSLDMAPRT